MASKVPGGGGGGDVAATDRILRDLGKFQISSDRPRLSAEEELVLSLYDELEDVRLRQAILDVAASEMPVDDKYTAGKEVQEKLQRDLDEAERDMLEARTVWLIRRHVVEDVLSVDPVLRAVHADPSGGARERDLRRLLGQRDVLSMAHAAHAAELREARGALLAAQVGSIRAVEENRALAHELRAVDAEVRGRDLFLANHNDNDNESGGEDGRDGKDEGTLTGRLRAAEADLARARRRRRLVKGVVSAAVVGSGLDWSEDERLLRLVLEEDE